MSEHYDENYNRTDTQYLGEDGYYYTYPPERALVSGYPPQSAARPEHGHDMSHDMWHPPRSTVAQFEVGHYPASAPVTYEANHYPPSSVPPPPSVVPPPPSVVHPPHSVVPPPHSLVHPPPSLVPPPPPMDSHPSESSQALVVVNTAAPVDSSDFAKGFGYVYSYPEEGSVMQYEGGTYNYESAENQRHHHHAVYQTHDQVYPPSEHHERHEEQYVHEGHYQDSSSVGIPASQTKALVPVARQYQELTDHVPGIQQGYGNHRNLHHPAKPKRRMVAPPSNPAMEYESYETFSSSKVEYSEFGTKITKQYDVKRMHGAGGREVRGRGRGRGRGLGHACITTEPFPAQKVGSAPARKTENGFRGANRTTVCGRGKLTQANSVTYDERVAPVVKKSKGAFHQGHDFKPRGPPSEDFNEDSTHTLSDDSEEVPIVPVWARSLSSSVTCKPKKRGHRAGRRIQESIAKTKAWEEGSHYVPGGYTQTCAGKHPALAVNEFFQGNRIFTIGDNFAENVTQRHLNNRFFVGIILPSHNDRMFYAVAVNEKIAKYEVCATALKEMNITGWRALTDHLNLGSTIDKMAEMHKFRELVPFELKTDSGEFLDVVTYAQRLFDVDELEFDEPILISTHPKDSIYKATVKIKTYTFMEIGNCPEEAKRRLAWTVIKLAENKDMQLRLNAGSKVSYSTDSVNNMNFSIHDKIMFMVFETIAKNTKHLPSKLLDFYNVAAVLLLSGDFEEIENYKLVAVATGSNCINKIGFKKDGSAIHDSNAVVLAVRALRSYLFDQLNEEDGILEASDCEGYKFKLKDQYKVIMVMNFAPPGCGDILVNKEDGTPDSDLCQLRTLAVNDFINCSCQFKYLPCKSESSLYSDTEKHCIASPSDKITMLNVAGINGALLAQFIEPIYIDAFSMSKVGKYYRSINAMKQAIYERISDKIYQDLPTPFTLYEPNFRFVSFIGSKSRDNLNDQRISDYSGWINCWGEETVCEVIKQSRGLAVTDIPEALVSRKDFVSDVEYYSCKAEEARKVEASLKPSQLSKQSLFKKYKDFSRKIGKTIPDSYFACKDLADDYHQVKCAVKKAFISAGLGTWPEKHVNTDCFKIPVRDINFDKGKLLDDN